MGRDKRVRQDRDGGQFAALPHVVLKSVNFKRLSHRARSMLIELALQLGNDNNGTLNTGRKYLSDRGWKSSHQIQEALEELTHYGFVHQTVEGHRPNKASWWAVTWRSLDRHDNKYDPHTRETFVRSAYLNVIGVMPKKKRSKPAVKNDGLSANRAQETPAIGANRAQGEPLSSANRAPIKADFDQLSSANRAHHLENAISTHH